MAEEKKYKQVRTPDVSRISNIVLSAKGVGRTMAQFAELTRLNASSLSRMANGKIKKPLTMDVIDAIMNNKSPECEYDKESLIRANGMVDEEKYERRDSRDRFRERRRAYQDRVISMRNILINELFARGIVYKRALGDELNGLPIDTRMFSSSMQRLCLEMIDSKNEKYWVINSTAIIMEPGDDERDVEYFKRHILNSYATIFLADAWEPES